ncbi:hypothetical protein SMD22_10665 [Brevibacillus halotolerans]|uniref:hypothetical protein n=1 Tax=Brevibacillus laterosporus TaxID=1465 RepID=UPI00215D4A38|nr:hypothetical protein [Brevibacillus laterosporus]MCR8994977.1 hypothetical protein [Brevibacillus laterosporus]WPS89379.1 hypothetical protein SMD22_10665 [Brevibacillus halotolerans]
MKRITFQTPNELADYGRERDVAITVEYRDENGKQRQVILSDERLAEIGEYLAKTNAMAYFKEEKIFYEVNAAWLRA